MHADALRLGPPRGEKAYLANAEKLAGVLSQAGVAAEATDRYLAYLWGKLIYNFALNPFGALLRRTYGELVRIRPLAGP